MRKAKTVFEVILCGRFDVEPEQGPLRQVSASRPKRRLCTATPVMVLRLEYCRKRKQVIPRIYFTRTIMYIVFGTRADVERLRCKWSMVTPYEGFPFRPFSNRFGVAT